MERRPGFPAFLIHRWPKKFIPMKKLLLSLGLLAALAAPAQVPQLINYQGRITVGGTNYDATGTFKFALVNTAGTLNYWANDGTARPHASTTARAIDCLRIM